MLIPCDPDRFETVTGGTTCEFHKKHPGKTYAGCTCSTTYGLRAVNDGEYRRRQAERERREDDAVLRKAASIRAKRRRVASGTPTRRAETPKSGSVGKADGGPTLEEGDAHDQSR